MYVLTCHHIHRAATNCDLFVLTKADLDRALTYYPEIAEQIRTVAGNRANLVKKRSQIAAKAAAEGKSAADAAKAAAQVLGGGDLFGIGWYRYWTGLTCSALVGTGSGRV